MLMPSSHWIDYHKPEARPGLSQRGSDLVELTVENCLKHILLFVFIVASPET